MESNIPHDDYHAGFTIGWQMLLGTESDVPNPQSQPEIPNGSTPFLEGIKDGLDAIPKVEKSANRNYVEVRACRHHNGTAGCFFASLYEALN